MGIYTRKGDDGTTALLFGGRVRKDAPRIELNGAIDEAQAALGAARAEAAPGSELDVLLASLERALYVVMAEVATAPQSRSRLAAGTSQVTDAMVAGLEARIDELVARTSMPSDFVIPGGNRCSAALDVARTVVRRAERLAVAAEMPDSAVVRYLNRLSDLVWVLARWQEGDSHQLARTAPRAPRARRPTDRTR